MKFKITWYYDDGRTYTQVLSLVNCRADKKDFFTMNSLIYEAIENGTFCISNYGLHKFRIEEQ
jgi:hypothetical protein